MHDTLTEIFSVENECEWDSGDNAKLAAQNTFSDPLPVLGIIRPKHRRFISLALKAANRHRFHILPVSSNRNWGYGTLSAQSLTLPLVILDLQLLTKITPTDKGLGLITLEPGVTQKQLGDYFKTNNWNYMVPVTGAGPHCSIVSNAIERGYGITPHTDHFGACTALKAYVAHPALCGKEMSSAVSELDHSGEDLIDKTFKWGLGPYLDGLFTQSNLGVVTEMTFRLAPLPHSFCAFYIQIFDDAHFESAVYFIQTLLSRYAGSIGSVNLMDRRRLLSMTVDNPNVEKTKSIFLSDQQVAHLGQQHKVPEWLVVGSIYGEKDIVNVIKKAIRKLAKNWGKILFSDSPSLAIAKSILNTKLAQLPALKKVKTQLDKLEMGKQIMLGEPNQIALPLAYWRNPNHEAKNQTQLHPANDQCGLLWYAPLVKMDALCLRQFVTFVRTTMHEFDFDPFITFTNLRHDCIDSTVPIVFNLQDKTETKRANECLSALIDNGVKQGFVPYRLSASEQQRINASTPYWQCVEQIKMALDPNNVISPRRYCFTTQTS
jgi:4-cresol dehydrogenase (hydroxylating)